MFDWQISEEGLPQQLPAEQEVSSRRRRWRVLLLLLPLLVAVAGIFLWQVKLREEALLADLQLVIDEEERLRSFGLVDEAESITVGNASARWMTGYRGRLRRADDFPPVTIADVELQRSGTVALVTVNEGEHQRLRTYRLSGDSWKRGPLPKSAWGAERTHPLAGGTTLRYWTLDDPFAEQLAEDWEALLVLLPDDTPLKIDEIEVEPIEFRKAAHVIEPDEDDDPTRLLLASPQLVHYHPWLSGEELVRYKFAYELLYQSRSVGWSSRVPNEISIQLTLQEVAALRWALSAERMDALRVEWRAAIDERWISPLVVDAEDGLTWEQRPHAPNSDTAIQLLLADLMLNLGPPMARQQLFDEEHREIRSWDGRLQELLGTTSYALEQRLERYIEAGLAVALDMEPAPPSEGRVTLSGTLEVRSSNPREPEYLFFPTEDERGTRLFLEGSTIALPDGSELRGTCAPLFEDIAIEGRWAGDGQALIAEQVVVESVAPARGGIDVPPVPDDAILLSTTGQIYGMSNDAALIVEVVSSDGSTTSLHPESPPVGVMVPALGDRWSTLFGIVPPADCSARWLYLYHPESGMIGPWLQRTDSGETNPGGYIVEMGDESQEGPWLLVTGFAETQTVNRLERGAAMAEPLPELDQPGMLIGWRSAEQEFVMMERDASKLEVILVPFEGGERTLVFSEEANDQWAYFNPSADALIIQTENGASRIISVETGEQYEFDLLRESDEEVFSYWQEGVAVDLEKELVIIQSYTSRSQGAAPDSAIVALTLAGEEIDRHEPEEENILRGTHCPNGEVLLINFASTPTDGTFGVHIQRWRPGSEPTAPMQVPSPQLLGGSLICLLDE